MVFWPSFGFGYNYPGFGAFAAPLAPLAAPLPAPMAYPVAVPVPVKVAKKSTCCDPCTKKKRTYILLDED